uniref:Cytoplasmic dynein 2 light intermediate chain 1 n=1 Tax=Syphacia muris TaxID=451379 RepID=A0A0N5AZ36_9BILA
MDQREESIIFCGDKSSGKTTIINRFLERTENPKPTIALEYAYGRRTRGNVRDLVHIWELGGGTVLKNLLEIPLSASKIDRTSMIIVLDLSKLEEIWNTFYSITKVSRKIISEIAEELKIKSPAAYERFQQRLQKFKTYKDVVPIDPFPIPLIIAGSKYDIFQNYEPEIRKITYKYLRYMAHSNGASVQMFSHKLENTVLKMRAHIGHIAFGANIGKTIVTDYNKPLYVLPGKDSYTDIGTPPNADFVLSQMNARNSADLWGDAFEAQFSSKKGEKKLEKKSNDDIIGDVQFQDPDIDSLFEQKSKVVDLKAFIKRKRDRQEPGGKLQ